MSKRIHRLVLFVLIYSININIFANFGSDSKMIMLLIDKSSLTATLYTMKRDINSARAIESFHIAIGKEQGDKYRQGDNRTPEGIYFTEDAIAMKKFNFYKYGDLAIPLSFPNLFDRYQEKSGYGIWLHGSGDEERIRKKFISEGCVVFKNEDIKKMQQWLLPNSSIVIIVENKDDFTHSNHAIKSLDETFVSWLESWKTRNISKYSDFYSDSFKYIKKTKSSFMEYKKRIFKSYKDISINIENYHSVIHPKYAMTISNLDFNGDNRYISKGRKILYWIKNKDRWQIIREFFDSNKIKPILLSETKLPSNIKESL